MILHTKEESNVSRYEGRFDKDEVVSIMHYVSIYVITSISFNIQSTSNP